MTDECAADAAHAPAASPAPTVILDSTEATARLLGDGGLYLRMLQRFCQDHPDGATPIRAAIDSGDLALAHRLAHTLKGTAGMLGAHRLRDSAAALEQGLHADGLAAAGAALASVEQALGEVLLMAQRLLAGEPAAGGTPAGVLATFEPAPGGAAALLRQLAALLDVGDGAAIDLLEQAGPSLKSAIGDAAFSTLMLAVHAFDFEAALAALQRTAPASALAEPEVATPPR